MAISSYSNPIPEIIDGLLRGHQLGLQMQQAARADQEFKTQQAMHNQQMSMQDIFNQQYLQEHARPVTDMGTVESPAGPSIPNTAPGMPSSPGAPSYIRKADPSRTVKYGGRQYEFHTPEEQDQAKLEQQTRGQEALAQATARIQQQQLEGARQLRGQPISPEDAAALGYPAGYRALPEENIAEKALQIRRGQQEIQKGYMLPVPAGTTVYDTSPQATPAGAPVPSAAAPGQPTIPMEPMNVPGAPAATPPLANNPTVQRMRVIASGGAPNPPGIEGFFLQSYAKAKNKTVSQLTPEEVGDAMSQAKTYNTDPEMRQLAIQSKQTQESMRQTQEAMRRMQESQMPNAADVETLARSTLDGTITPKQWSELRGGSRGAIGMKVFTRVKQLNPNFDVQKADSQFRSMEKTEDAFTSGRQADLVRSNNNALEHLALLDEARTALHNGDIQKLNQFANWIGVETGSNTATVFDQIAHRVGDEVSKAFIPGGGSAGERLAGATGYSTKNSDSQIQGNIRADVRLLDSQQRHLIDQYKRGTYGKGGQDLFTPEAMAARDRLLGQQAAGGPVQRAAPARGTVGPIGGTGMVNMRAPDGTVKPVPADQVQHYKSLGAVEVR